MTSQTEFRQANLSDLNEIWQIIQFAIASRKADGSKQWQDGYPNIDSIRTDINHSYAHVLSNENGIMAYAAVIFDIEPAYEQIEGTWLSNQNYVVVHRIAVSEKAKGQGFAKILMHEIEQLAIAKETFSIRVDTNYDNPAMLRILDQTGYQYCGEVYFRGDARKAFEKVLN